MDYAALKQMHRTERAVGMHPNLNLRLHRALSWLDRAERMADDPDGRFIFLWIAFNAAYSTDVDERYRQSEQDTFQEFLRKLVDLDRPGRIHDLVWHEFSGSIRLLLDNRYVCQDFWRYRSGVITADEWDRRFAGAKRAASQALARLDTVGVLGVALGRLYTLRNQLVHGGATWNSSVNREQLRDGVNLLGKLVPVILLTMLENKQALWGDACYPVVDGAP